jgi:hypothetical protein
VTFAHRVDLNASANNAIAAAFSLKGERRRYVTLSSAAR